MNIISYINSLITMLLLMTIPACSRNLSPAQLTWRPTVKSL